MAGSAAGAHTHDLAADNRLLTVDTDLIVHNRRTYPTLLRMFDGLGAPDHRRILGIGSASVADPDRPGYLAIVGVVAWAVGVSSKLSATRNSPGQG
jgi:hypothetical protein